MGWPLGARASSDPAGSSTPGSSDDLTRRATVLEAVINISEGRDAPWLEATAHSLACAVDLHSDVDHHRSVVTLLGEPDELVADVRSLVRSCLGRLDLGAHEGVHPRFGVVDVLPYVPLGTATMSLAIDLRDQTARWMAEELGVAAFLYGPLRDGSVRTLPEVRRTAFRTLAPDTGPPTPHGTAGATAVGARDVLVAWNVWLDGVDLVRARQLASMVRGPGVRALGLEVGDAVQVSCNLVEPLRHTPDAVLDAITASLVGDEVVRRCELVGLAPSAMLRSIPTARWGELDLSVESTIERAAEARGLEIS